MVRVYELRSFYRCKVIDEICGHTADFQMVGSSPDCKNCQDYLRWKKSGLTLTQWRNKEMGWDK